MKVDNGNAQMARAATPKAIAPTVSAEAPLRVTLAAAATIPVGLVVTVESRR